MSCKRPDLYLSGCRVSGVGWRVVGLAENITNSVKLELELGLSLAISKLFLLGSSIRSKKAK